jgi:molybdopterin-guanine dinucleotide biosynthesis protein A
MAAFESLEIPVFIDMRPDSGPLGGIHTALSTTKHPSTFVVGCDYPFINSHFIRGLADLLPGHDAVVPRKDRTPIPVCAFYSTRCLASVETSLDRGMLEAKAFLSHVDVRWVEGRELKKLDPSGVALFNLNTPEDYAKALTLLEEA